MQGYVIRPQIRGTMQGALVKENGVIRELRVELPDAARILDRITNVVRQMAGAIVELGGSAAFEESHAAAIEADLARLRELL